MKTAIVTGASSGVGQAMASQLLDKDWKVYGLSRRKPHIQNAGFVHMECDLAEPDQIPSALQAVSESRIDLVVSNAGVAFKELASAVTVDSFDRMFSVNVLAPMLLIQALKPKIIASTVISISSVSDRLIEKDFALYCSSKAANTRYFEALAIELNQAKVITLLPDYVDTPMLRQQEAADFDWASTINVQDLARLAVDISEGGVKIESGANIIIVTNKLKQDLVSREKLYSFNTDTQELTKLY